MTARAFATGDEPPRPENWSSVCELQRGSPQFGFAKLGQAGSGERLDRIAAAWPSFCACLSQPTPRSPESLAAKAIRGVLSELSRWLPCIEAAAGRVKVTYMILGVGRGEGLQFWKRAFN